MVTTYNNIHKWIKYHKKKPILCEECKKKKPLQLANISGYYKKDINDWLYCCGDCHRDKHKKGEHKNIKFKDMYKKYWKNLKEENPKKYLRELKRKRLHDKKWRRNNTNKKRQYNQKWYLENKDKKEYKKLRKVYKHKWYLENKEEALKGSKIWKKKNKERIIKRAKEYYQENKEKINKQNRDYKRRMKNENEN